MQCVRVYKDVGFKIFLKRVNGNDNTITRLKIFDDEKKKERKKKTKNCVERRSVGLVGISLCSGET